MNALDNFLDKNLLFSYQIIYSFLSLVLSFYLTKKCIPFLVKFFIDLPNKRGSHYSPKPKAGGIVFLFLSSFIFLIHKKFIFLLALPLAIVGLIDDYKGLSTSFRLIFQAIIASLFFIFDKDNFFIFNMGSSFFILNILFLVIFMGIINTMNFMDGIDGLVCSCMIIILLTISIKYDLVFLPITFSLVGFLFFNWTPAKVFMGDVGSTFLGFLYAAILLRSNSIVEFAEIFLLFIPLFMDAFSCRLRLLIKGRNLFKPHKLHLYQRLHQAGLSHADVTLIYLSSTLILSISLFLFNIYFSYCLAFLIISFGFYLEKNIAVKF